MSRIIDPAQIEFPLNYARSSQFLDNIKNWFLKWADFIKIEHTLFALPFAISSMALAAYNNRGWPGWKQFLLIVCAMFCARTSAMIFNRLVDNKLDAINPRTALRHLPTGKISIFGAIIVWLISSIGFVLCAYALNQLCFILSPIALFIIWFYTFAKRFTDFSHFFLGLALGLAPIGSWIAVKGEFVIFKIIDGHLLWRESGILPIILSLAIIFWVAGFDVIYAIQDYEFDRRHRLHSLVVRWGINNALKAAFLFHLIMWVLLGVFGLLARFYVAYLVGIGIIGLAIIIEHWLVQRRSLRWINIAFYRLNILISVTFFITTVTEVVFPWFRNMWQ